jgi:Ca2+-dependent lipid-binding protein
VAWPAAVAAAAEAVPPLVDAALADALPPWLGAVRLARFDLGSAPPTVEGVKVYPPPLAPPEAAAPGGGAGGAGGSGDRLMVEVDVAWVAGPGQGVELALVPLLPSPARRGRGRGRGGVAPPAATTTAASLGSALAGAVTVTAGLSRASLRARVRVEAGPLVRTLPLAGSVSACLVHPPDLGFELRLLGGDLSLLPGLESWLGGLLREKLRPYTLPGRFVYPLVAGPPPAPRRPAGALRLVLVEAAALPRLDFWSASDAYATAALVAEGGAGNGGAGAGRPGAGGGSATTARTRVVHNSARPVWAAGAVLVVADPALQALQLSVWDADVFTGQVFSAGWRGPG